MRGAGRVTWVAVPLAGLLAAAGLASTATATVGAPSVARLSKEAYIKQGDAICQRAIADLRKLGRLYPARKAAAVGSRYLAIDRRTLAALRSLSAPPADRDRIRKLLALADTAINKGIVGVVAAARSGNKARYTAAVKKAQAMIDKAHASARAYGFSACARW
ncbi:MAG: hypothetical protein H0U03_10880 [Actinobacteria bacterium]|nr:hypothetical protein [Actinomycetota bacterium]